MKLYRNDKLVWECRESVNEGERMPRVNPGEIVTVTKKDGTVISGTVLERVIGGDYRNIPGAKLKKLYPGLELPRGMEIPYYVLDKMQYTVTLGRPEDSRGIEVEIRYRVVSMHYQYAEPFFETNTKDGLEQKFGELARQGYIIINQELRFGATDSTLVEPAERVNLEN